MTLIPAGVPFLVLMIEDVAPRVGRVDLAIGSPLALPPARPLALPEPRTLR